MPRCNLITNGLRKCEDCHYDPNAATCTSFRTVRHRNKVLAVTKITEVQGCIESRYMHYLENVTKNIEILEEHNAL